MKRVVLPAAILAGLLFVQGCSSNSYFSSEETALGTNRRAPSLSHIAAYFPGAISLISPGYLIGIEAARPYRITREGDLVVRQMRNNGEKVDYLVNLVREGHLHFISEVFRYTGKPYGDGNCALYNLYRGQRGGIIPFCEETKTMEVNVSTDSRRAYTNSWTALDILRRRLETDIESGKYTHLMVLMMGMDTKQEESIRNFNSIIWSIRQTAGNKFRPLTIGISWPSYWDSRWFQPAWDLMSYPSRADEADRLGLSWVGVLFQEIIDPLSEKIQTVAISHSLGARAISMAACVGPAITRNVSVAPAGAKGRLDYFFGFAPAFSLSRFSKKSYLLEDIYYRNSCAKIRKMIFTASDKDTASKANFWADLAGNHRYYTKFCQQRSEFSKACVKTNEKGLISQAYNSNVRLLYIDTTDLMKYEIPLAQGGGHSDVFRPEVGRLVWDVMGN